MNEWQQNVNTAILFYSVSLAYRQLRRAQFPSTREWANV